MENVYIVDTKNLSTGIALLAMYASKLNQERKSYEEIISAVEEKKDKLRTSFIIEKLNYLYKGGRCSALTLLGANVLKIKPQIVVENGRMSVGKKYIGSMNKIVNKYCDDLMEQYPNIDLDNVFITHSSPMPELQQSLQSKLKERGFENVYDTLAGGTISSHCGPNCIGILFFEK
jgi:DegV family protein with EDD domain